MLNRIEGLEQVVKSKDEEIVQLKSDLQDLQDTVDNQSQALIRNELEIIGIPELKNENLNHLTSLLWQKNRVNLKEEDVDRVYRAGFFRNQDKTKPPYLDQSLSDSYGTLKKMKS